MPTDHHFVCPLPGGLHARPASCLEEVARKFASEIILLNRRTGGAVNAKSVLAILSADIRQDDECVLTVHGPDEGKAMAALAAFVSHSLPHCDDARPSFPTPRAKSPLPFILRGTGLTAYHGTPVVEGVAQGRVVQIGALTLPASPAINGVADPDAEWRALEEALQKLIALYDQRLAAAKTKIESALWKAHRAIARDLEFRRQLHDAIIQSKRTPAEAIAAAEAHFSKMLSSGGSTRLRERTLDMQDVCLQLLQQVYGNAPGSTETHLDADAIVAAESLTPGQFLALDRNLLKGLALGVAGTTSHTVILARSFGIPTLTGVSGLARAGINGEEAVLDADAGIVLTHLTETARRYYAMERQRLEERRYRLLEFSSLPATTQDGRRIEIGANIASPDEAVAAFSAGAEGVGLLRTEMLFVERESAPDEAEQYEMYGGVLAAAKGLPVIIRTLDVGGDKPLNYLNLPAEENPFLGYRALRIYPEFEALFRAQLRAIIRASADGQTKLLLPMIATVEEARWVKKIIAEEQLRCAGAGLAFNQKMPVGAMVEVPAAAFVMDALARELDFFSIGTNDLLQYFMAADRSNPRVAKLYNPLNPAFLRLLQQIVAAARANKRRIGLCGEMGGQKMYLPLLVGLSLDEISVAVPAIATLKAELAGLNCAACEELFRATLDCATTEEVAALLENFNTRHLPALIEPELVVLNSQAVTKEEAIKAAADRLYVLGRTENFREVEEAIWQRELTYSTGFGHGFAIPHCKSNAMRFTSLVLLKLRTPVDWNSLDGQPVRVALLFAVREAGGAAEHMKVLAKLARRLMDENFRASLEKENDAGALCACLREALQLTTRPPEEIP